MPLKLDISNLQKINLIIKIDTGIKFGNKKPKICVEISKREY